MRPDRIHADRADLIDRARSLCRPMRPLPTGAGPRLPRLDAIRAVLFDVYGTMLISGSGDVGVHQARDSADALREALAAAGPAARGADAGRRGVELLHDRIHTAHRKRRGQGVAHPEVDIREIWAEALAALNDEGLIDGDADAAMVERLAVEYECRVNPVWPMPGLDAALRASGRTLGIVSNAQFFTPIVFEAVTGRSVRAAGFDERRCIWSYRLLEAKPSTALYERALDALRHSGEIEPRQVLYIGNDVLNDILPAARLGIRTALFAGDRRSLRWRDDEPDCRDVRPDAVLTGLGSLAEVLP